MRIGRLERKMITIKNIKTLGIILAIVLVYLAISPFFTDEIITNNTIATTIILILVAIAYIVVIFKPQWNKALLLLEGVVVAIVGYMFLDIPYNYLLTIIGLIIIIIAILAYLSKLPSALLKFFYR